jgi:acyl-coenzyme A synthetase/AMP-(fatty) acid ligase
VGLARGYKNAPNDPFMNISIMGSQRRVYRTGDLFKKLEGNSMEFRGRKDNGLKVRGFRVEPAEIEAVLNLHESVKQSVVTLVKDDRTGNEGIERE